MRWLLLSFALVIVSVHSSEPQRKQDEKPAAKGKAGASTNPIFVKILPSKADEEKAEKERQHESNEERIAIGTEKLVKGTNLLVVVTGVLAAFTAFLFGATVVLAHDARRASERQAKEMQDSLAISNTSSEAANKSAEIAERALVAGQRAFVSVASFRTVGLVDFKTGNITHWGFAPVWTNAGDTPTRNMKNHISVMYFVKEMPSAWDFPDLWPPNTPMEKRISTSLGISPKNFIHGQVIKIPVEEIEQVIAGKKSLYLWGWASYSDVFPETERHITRFAMQIHIGGDPHSKDPSQISFDYLNLSKYNCSDDECQQQGYPVDWAARQLEVG
jgi:hypothetical protein